MLLARKNKKYVVPAEYEQVEYLESTGEQWIGLPFIYDKPTKIKMTFLLKPTESWREHFAMGVYGFSLENVGNLVQWCCFLTKEDGSQWQTIPYQTIGDKVVFELFISNTNCYAIVNGTKLDYAQGCKYVGNSGLKILKNKAVLYGYFTIEQDNVTVFDGVTCYRKSDSKPGLYDTVSNTFFTNSGTGEFLVGPKVNALEYVLVGRKKNNELQLLDLDRKHPFITLNIEGTGTLTSEIVEQAILGLSPSNRKYVNKIVIGEGFTSANSGSLDSIDTFDLKNNLELKLHNPFKANIYTNLNETSTKIKKIVFSDSTGSWNTNGYRNQSQVDSYDILTSESLFYPQGFKNNFKLYARNVTSLLYCFTDGSLYCPKLTTFSAARTQFENKRAKIFIGTDSCNAIDDGTHRMNTTYTLMYLPAKLLKKYYNGDNGTLWVNQYILDRYCGVLDGANIYQNIDNKLSMNYPTLSSALTLNKTNGHLIENGVDLFEGYTATWYSDEDCTQVISPNNITNEMTVYVKLN